MALNNISIMGRITHDLELHHTQSGKPVITFTVAVDRDGKDAGTDFLTCVAWSGVAEFINSYFAKGQLIVINGRLQSRNYEDKNGNKRTAVEVVANHAWFGSPKTDNKAPATPKFERFEDDSDLPF